MNEQNIIYNDIILENNKKNKITNMEKTKKVLLINTHLPTQTGRKVN